MGHQKVIETAVAEAKRRNIRSAVLTFDPHPSVVLQGNRHVQYLTSPSEKAALIEACGVDELFIVTFDQSLAQLRPEAFIQHYLIDLQAVFVTAGFDFTFGHKGLGTVDTLKSYAGNNFDVEVVQEQLDTKEKISSTRIRGLIQSGNVEEAKRLLGRPYTLSGTVARGEGRGKTIGVPTANIEPMPESFVPGKGVYAVKVHSAAFNGVRGGMCNVGYKPTFHNEEEGVPTVEVHLFDFEQDIYGEHVSIEWLTFLRPERKFPSVDALIQQLHHDRLTAQEIVAKY
ncbi:riboflavin biosynthesis protein RibF [Litoribacterium kuwaitense]|uniref:riboflavin biosynthesis protein RibF n=1 Tax=Litoribacterium kuwaitense TaxID=1398745 RepID=UPI0028ADB773|nr:riboflavin biosynthesis protein RibF [Litoribacterium kuwaitense]